MSFGRCAWYSLALHLLLSGVCCWLPLVNVLAYEYACVCGVLAVPMAMWITAAAAQLPLPSWQQAWLAATRSMAVLIPGALLVAAHSLWIAHCDIAIGAQLYLLLPLGSACFAAMVSVTIATWLPPSLPRVPLLVMFALLALGLPIYRLYATPAIFFFNHLWGYFAGSLYDEAIGVDTRLLAFRLGTLVLIVPLLLGLFCPDRRDMRLGWVGILLLAWLLEAQLAYRFGYRREPNLIALWYRRNPWSSANGLQPYLQQTLAVANPYGKITLHLPSDLPLPTAQLLARDVQWRLHGLCQTLKITKLHAPIDIFVYQDARQKSLLMGGSNTMVAKPWLHQVHVHGTEVPHPLLAHELSHALAAEFGSHLLNVSARFELWLNMGLIEGFAEAMGPSLQSVWLHQRAQSLLDSPQMPPLQNVLHGFVFWGYPPQTVYSVVGSFVRYLYDTYGADLLKQVYAQGNFAQVYGQSETKLQSDWLTYLRSLPPLSRPEQSHTAALRTSKSIFRKICARSIAQMRAQAALCHGAKQLQLYQAVLSRLGEQDWSAQIDVAVALGRIDVEAALHYTEHLLQIMPQLSNEARRYLQLQQVGLLAQLQRWSAAKALVASWQHDADMTPSWQRQTLLLQTALDDLGVTTSLIELLVHHQIDHRLIATLTQAWQSTGNKTWAYLLGHMAMWQQQDTVAWLWLQRAAQHPHPAIAAEQLRLLGIVAWRLQKWQLCRESFTTLQRDYPSALGGEQWQIEDWRQRCQFEQQQASMAR